MTRRNDYLLAAFTVLSLVLCLCVLMSLSSSLLQITLNPSPYYCAVPIALALLALAPVIPSTRKLLPRILLGCWLALLLRSAFDQLFIFDYPLGSYPWSGYFIYGLILGVPLVTFAFKPVSALGPIKLTVITGFLIVIAYDILSLSYNYDWFGMYVRLGLGMWERDDTGWSSYFLVWLTNSDWIGFRIITYAALGYLLAKRKGLFFAMAISVLVALVDITLGWLVFLPHSGDFEAVPLSLVLQYELAELFKAMLAQVVDLSIFALLGALVTLVRWPWVVRRPIRAVPMTKAKRRRRPARLVSSRT